MKLHIHFSTAILGCIFLLAAATGCDRDDSLLFRRDLRFKTGSDSDSKIPECLARKGLNDCIETWEGSTVRESCFTEVGNGCAEGVVTSIVAWGFIGDAFNTIIENIDPATCEAKVRHSRHDFATGFIVVYDWNSIVCASDEAVTMNALKGSEIPPEMEKCAYGYSNGATMFQMVPSPPKCPTTTIKNYQQLRECAYYDEACDA